VICSEDCVPPANVDEECRYMTDAAYCGEPEFELVCAEGLSCTQVSDTWWTKTWQCRGPGAEHTACDPAASACAPDLVCVASNACRDDEFTCMRRVEDGEVCNLNRWLDGVCVGGRPPCLEGSVCDTTTHECRPGP
jgi:hypothetical protein